LNQPLRAPLASPPQAQQKPPVPIKPKPNDPFREQLSRFKKKFVRVVTTEGKFEGKLICFDYGSKALVIESGDSPILLSHYHSIVIIDGQ